ncbi:T cell receptor delta variable 3 [Manis javanica]|nr:T cell receptor delta variable 3 [Manis javanica]
MMLLAFSLLFYNRVLCATVTQGSPDQTVTSGSKHSQTRKNFHLVISSVEIEDSATYYCALRSTVINVPTSLSHFGQATSQEHPHFTQGKVCERFGKGLLYT